MARARGTADLIRATATVVLTAIGIAVVLRGLWRAQVALTLVVLALLVAVALDRIVAWLEARGLARGLAIALVMLAVVGALAALAVLFVPPAVAQVRQAADAAPAILTSVERSSAYRMLQRHVDVSAALQHLRGRAPGLASAVVGEAVGVVTWLAGAIAALVTLLFVVTFMLASGPSLVSAAMGKVRPERRPIYADVVSKLYRSLGGYVGGLFLLVLSNMAFSGVFLGVTGVPYFLPLAVFAGLSSLVPFAGALAAGALLSVVGWASGGTWLGLGTLAYYVAYQQLENQVIGPLVYRHTVDLNPLVVLLAALFMAELNGIAGALVAVPLAATVQIVLRELFRLRRGRLERPRTERGPALRDPGARPPRPAEAGDGGRDPGPPP